MIGRDEDVVAGDVLITSGIAEIRERATDGSQEILTARGFSVGVITSATSPSDQIFKAITVAPSASLDRNETVFVVTAPDPGGTR